MKKAMFLLVMITWYGFAVSQIQKGNDVVNVTTFTSSMERNGFEDEKVLLGDSLHVQLSVGNLHEPPGVAPWICVGECATIWAVVDYSAVGPPFTYSWTGPPAGNTVPFTEANPFVYCPTPGTT